MKLWTEVKDETKRLLEKLQNDITINEALHKLALKKIEELD